MTRTVRASAAPPLDRNSMRFIMLCAVLSTLSLLVFEWGRPMGWPSGGLWVLANLVTMLLAGLLLLGLYLLARHWGWLAVRAPGPRAVRYLLLAAVGIPIGGVRALLMILLHPGAAPAELLPTHLLLGATFYPLMGVWAHRIWSLTTRLELQRAALEQQLRTTKELRARLIAREDEMRRDVAELLHGRIQSRLLVAWQQLGESLERLGAEPDRARELLAQAYERIEEICERDVRQASHLLHPAIIRVGLVPALHSLAEQVGREHGLDVEVTVGERVREVDHPAYNRLPLTTRLAAYRGVEEALLNAAKHARPCKVVVSARVSGDTLHVAVVDDGAGFDPLASKRGLGLNAVEDRLQHLGGTLAVRSAPGKGTRVAMTIPFEPARPEPAARPREEAGAAVA